MKNLIILFALLATASVTVAQTKKSNAQIFTEYLKSAGAKSPKETASYFAKNGTLELPFNESIGMHYKLVGQDSIEAAIAGVVKNAPDFRLVNIKIIMETTDKVLAEYESETLLLNGRTYKQKIPGLCSY